MYVIIVKLENGKALPILSEDEETMALFDTWQEAFEFSCDHILCKQNESIIIPLDE